MLSVYDFDSSPGLRDYRDALVPFQETVTKADEVFVSQLAVGMDKDEAQKQLDTVRVCLMYGGCYAS